MRIKVYAEIIENDIMRWNYQYSMMQLIYDLISDTNLRKEIHDYGYKHNGRVYKSINFSNIFGKMESYNNNGVRFRDGQIYFFISSISTDVLNSILINILKHLSRGKAVRLGNVRIVFRSVDLIEDIIIPDQNIFIVKTLSPISLHKYDSEKDKKIVIVPYSEEYSKYVTNHLIRKSKAVFGIDYNPNEVYLELRPLSHESVRSKLIDIKGGKIKAYEGTFVCYIPSEKSKELLKTGYLLGVGERNGIGLGMIDILPAYGYWKKL